MSLTPSTEMKVGTKVPDFDLPNVVDNTNVLLSNFDDKQGTVIIFMCNHCPYVKNIKEALVDFANDYQKDIDLIAINPNDVENYPQDRPEKMRDDAKRFGYPFPYLYDKDQSVAHAYRAACTPDIYLIDDQKELVYHGQFDDSRPGNDQPPTGHDLRVAVDRMLAGKKPIEEQKPCMGCNIKWKKGNEPAYFG